MNEVRNGEQKEHRYLYFETCYGCQKLHKYFRSLLIKDASLLTWSYIRELRNGRKFKCENKRFIIFILFLKRVVFQIFFLNSVESWFHNRFICVGVDISMRYSQGDGVNTSLSRITYCTHVVYTSPSLVLCSFPVCLWVSSVARSCATKGANNKDNVWKPSIPAGINCPPPSKTISPITWFGTISPR